MDNQVYRIRMSEDHKLEFYIFKSNEIKPHKDIKGMGVIVYKDGQQVDGDLDESELDSLIKFLTDCQDHIFNFNKKITE